MRLPFACLTLLSLPTACAGAAYRVTPGAPSAQAEASSSALAVGDDAPSPSGASAMRSPSIATDPAHIPEQLVIEGYVEAEVDDVREAANGLRAAVLAFQGRIVNEQLDGGETSWRATFKVRVPPGAVDGLLDWLGKHGDVKSKRLSANDVSKTLFDQDIALENLKTTLERLRKLNDTAGLAMKDILDIEREMTRLRGEIESLEGEQRFLKDRVGLATLDVELERSEHAAVLSPKSKFYPGARFGALILLDPSGRQRTRFGGGFALHIPVPRVSFELDVFEEASDKNGENKDNAVLATFGGAFYSDFMGAGKRRFCNPYLGFRAGYGYLDRSSFVLQGDAGVEIFKHTNVMIDANVRMTGFLNSDTPEAALVAAGSVIFAF